MDKIKNVLFIIAVLVVVSPVVYGTKIQQEFYQIKIYHLKSNDQVALVDQYLKDAYLPALHRLSIKNIGVFKPIANDTSSVKFIYVLIPFQSSEAWMNLDKRLTKDIAYMAAAKSFIEAPSDKAPYERMESILLDAFSGQGHLLIPSTKNAERVFELRSYESPTLHLAEKKMDMFNSHGEIQIFNRLKFNPVFYAKVVSGSRMPNFMYMPIFESVEHRNAQWKVFGNDPKWKEISTDPVNENKVSVNRIESILMHSTDYSDF
ncbi:MAG TPA: NIPSNAP family protein [Hanamia sp.]|nr:NIPSNAP family protein [Hanamia sp.]